MADERSPLLEHGSEIDYSAVNEPEQADSDSVADAEEQQTVVAPQNSVIALVRLGNFRIFILTLLLWTKVIPMAIGIFLCAMDQTIIVACM
jgi:uncharacterized membrane protein